MFFFWNFSYTYFNFLYNSDERLIYINNFGNTVSFIIYSIELIINNFNLKNSTFQFLDKIVHQA